MNGWRLCAASLCLAAAVGAATSAEASDKRQQFIGTMPIGGIALPVRTMQDLKYANVVRQQYDFSCGSAALATLLALYGEKQSEAVAFRGMWAGGDHAQIRKLGFSLLDMKRYLATRRRVANGYKVSIDAITKAAVPGIALITVKGYRHFVVIEGIRGGDVLIGDPALGLRVQPVEDFQKSWNGIFFVIDGDLPQGRANFNAAQHWAAFARAPTGSRFSDPLALQALSLTAPFYGDF